ncbi:hypothetical protein [Nocardioides daeguensis]|uniref:Carboxypeptidase regulatory-like domain-containing protein n=1 Tax=Nocardioides daeguensis TaxID=908359 RepID=A0ABP6VM98_9ACTN|nr:hypothetical protein [Nocardioides daeguensis]MBV6727320.1 hypothetical protein [Nocardioides daeguensis]MCR1775409.1 hypothetical protein [Nocardioides daeguensis]
MSTDREGRDGLEEFEDSPLVRALRAPGTPEELAGEARFVAAFRDAQRPLSPAVRGGRTGRVVGRIGVGSAALLATVTLTGGMAAAAYTQRLPHPVQVLAHDAFGGVGVPPARPRTPPAPTPRATPPDGPAASPGGSARPGDRPSSDAAGSPRPGEDAPSSTESAPGAPDTTSPATGTTATGSTSASPSGAASSTGGPAGPTSPGAPTTTPGVPAVSASRVGATTSVRRVVTGARASVTGLVRDHGLPVEGAQVWLLQRHGTLAWAATASAVTGQDGSAIFATGPLVETTSFRVRVEVDTDDDGEPDRVLLSRPRRIAVQPLLTLSATGAVVGVHTVGASPGDAVTVSRRTADGSLVRLGIRRLDEAGDASYDLSGLTGRVRVQVRVLRTSTHTAVKRWITVRVPGEPPASGTPTPSASPTAEPTGSAGSSTTTGS